jgi:putative phage-type endonuclease
MITEKQREQRKSGIGGSDIGIILGLSSYKTPYQLYLEKIGEVESSIEETNFQEWGHRLEPMIRIKFAEDHGFKIRAPIEDAKFAPLCNLITYDLESQEHPFNEFLRGNLDGFIPELNAVHEIKCSNQFMTAQWGEKGSDIIPMIYLLQVAHYCAVTNADKAYITVLIGGYDYREFIYERNMALENKVIDAAKKFWECVQTRTPPAPINQIDLRLMYPRHNPDKTKSIAAPIARQLTTLADTRFKIKQLIEIEEQHKFNIMKFMEDAECLTDDSGRPLVSWKANRRGTRTFLVKGLQ